MILPAHHSDWQKQWEYHISNLNLLYSRGTAAAAHRRSGLATLPSVGAVP